MFCPALVRRDPERLHGVATTHLCTRPWARWDRWSTPAAIRADGSRSVRATPCPPQCELTRPLWESQCSHIGRCLPRIHLSVRTQANLSLAIYLRQSPDSNDGWGCGEAGATIPLGDGLTGLGVTDEDDRVRGRKLDRLHNSGLGERRELATSSLPAHLHESVTADISDPRWDHTKGVYSRNAFVAGHLLDGLYVCAAIRWISTNG